MKKNVLVIVGSPRAGGNTESLADAFIKGASSAGHEVTKFDAGNKKIGGCRGCKLCWTKAEPCCHRDDFDQLSPLLEKADVLVLASPLYWYTFTVQILGAINRMYAYVSDKCLRPLKIKKSYLLTCGADEEMQAFEGIIATYEAIVRYWQWADGGILAVPSVHEKGEINSTDALEKAKALGQGLL